MFHKNDQLWSGDVFSDFIHPDNNIPENWSELVIKQVHWKLHGTLHDIYTLPNFEDFTDINNFIINLEKINLDKPQLKETIVRDLILAYELAVDYLKKEWYYLPTLWKLPKKQSDLVSIAHKWQKYTNARERIAYCTLLKEILWFFRIIRYDKFKVDYDNWTVDLSNSGFIKEIIAIFENEPFVYHDKWARHFSWESDNMSCYAIIDGVRVDLNAWFRVKTLEAMIEKMDAQEKYEVAEAHKDTHWLRIEVATEEDALRICKVLFYKLWWDLEIQDIWKLIDTDIFSKYANIYLNEPRSESFREKFELCLQNPSEKKKSYSEKRKELKLTRKWNKPIEIQIVLVNNTNETWYAHHDIYKMRRKIVAKIRRHGWIGITGIKSIIHKVFEENIRENQWKCTIPYSEDLIFEHIIQIPNLLIWIKWATQILRDWNQKIRHYSTLEVIDKYKKNYPNVSKRWNVSIEMLTGNWIRTLTPINLVSFPSKTGTSSLLHNPDQ